MSLLEAPRWTTCLLRPIWCCLNLLNRAFYMHLICFLLRATKPEMKSAQKMSEILCLSRIIRQFRLQVSGNTLQQVEKFKYIGVVFTRDGGRTRRLIHGLVKQTQYCGHKTGAFKHRKAVIFFKSGFVPIFTYGHESWVMTERILTYSKCKRQRWDFCDECTEWWSAQL